ncbi:MAG: hypothetical protein PHO63_04690 [Bacilli bacterium]|nr:hypothetical protein [Bacilli bacterium]MDD4808583.1 hypothetical protein [Bacilli bacterium]
MNEKDLIDIANQYLKIIESKKWPDLTLDEIELIRDKDKRIDYRKRFFFCFKNVINPLYTNLPKKGQFTFSLIDKQLTCRIMVQDLKEHYLKYNYTKDDIIYIISRGNK